MKKLVYFSFALLVATTGLLALRQPRVEAAFNRNLIIGDSTFNDSGSMSAAQIDAFLNGFPYSCISTNSGFAAILPTGYSPSAGFSYGGYATAGEVIARSAEVYGLNPKALLVTLQKEQSLVAGGANYCNNGENHKYAAAVGYGCPDSGGYHSYTGVSLYRRNGVVISTTGSTCVNSAEKAGFSQQVIRAAWLLKFGQQRSLGNTGWAVITGSWDNSDDPPTCYGGPMTQGTLKRCHTGGATFFDGYTTIDGVPTHMDSGATAALYWYTPHFHGNENFYNIYSGWFGDPNASCPTPTNVGGATSGYQLIAHKYGGVGARLAFTQQNNTGSGCAETHVFNSGFQSWYANIATGMGANNPAGSTLLSMKAQVDQQFALTKIVHSGAGGRAEVHRMSPSFKKFPGYYDVSTNLTGVSAANSTFVAGDFLGRGYDQLAYIIYSNGRGRVEVHLFDPSLQTGVGYYDVETNLTGVSATSGSFVAANFLGRGYDQLAYVLNSNSNGKAEIHLFDQSLRNAVGFYDVETNLTGVSAANSTFVAGDFLGRGYGQLIYAINNNGIGRVETHMFNPSLTRATGTQDIITNLAGFDEAL